MVLFSLFLGQRSITTFFTACVLLAVTPGCNPDSVNLNSTEKNNVAVRGSSAGAISEISNLAETYLSAIQNEDSVQAINQSFAPPSLPSSSIPFEFSPEQRFELWSVVEMSKNDAEQWRWIEQQFVRVAVQKESYSSDSSWSFRDVMARSYRSFNFASGERKNDYQLERRAMALADVSSSNFFVGGVQASIESNGCQSLITLDRVGGSNSDVQKMQTQTLELTADSEMQQEQQEQQQQEQEQEQGQGQGQGQEHKINTSGTPNHRQGESRRWRVQQCPERLLLGNTVIASLVTSSNDEAIWFTQQFGHLPSSSGAVLIDRLEIILSETDTLSIDRSRRRSGSGPITVSATLENSNGVQSLRGVTWEERGDNRGEVSREGSDNGTVVEPGYPSEVIAHVPALEQTFVILIPNNAYAQANLAIPGYSLQHGVLATLILDSSSDSDSSIAENYPGLLTLQPRMSEGR